MSDFLELRGEIPIHSSSISVSVYLDGEMLGHCGVDGVTLAQWDRLRYLASRQKELEVLVVRPKEDAT